MTATTIPTAEPALLCVECGEVFDPADSPELEHCWRCAEFIAWFEGWALLGGSPRTGKPGRPRAVTELIDRVPFERAETEM